MAWQRLDAILERQFERLGIDGMDRQGGAMLNDPAAAATWGAEGATTKRMGMKNAEAEAPASADRENVSEDRSRGGYRPLSTRKHMLTVLPAASASRHVSSARPTRCVGSHLKLVWSEGHAALANSPNSSTAFAAYAALASASVAKDPR